MKPFAMRKPATGPTAGAVDSPWMTPKEAAAYLAVGVETIYDACATKGLKHARLGHSTIRLRREWLDAWIESRTQVHT